MKILVIMKRFGANKDMVMENFGRQIRLFEPLAKMHKIDFLCPDYKTKKILTIKKNGINYITKPVGLFSSINFLFFLKKLIEEEKYDIIIGTSDPLIGIIAHYCSKKYKIPFVYDLQDNFEIYDTFKIPLVPHFHKKSVKEADVVLTVSESLKEYISKTRKKSCYVIQNGIDLELFKPIDKIKARKQLRLPLKAKIIVYIGHLENLKGAGIMFDAFKKTRKKYPDTFLLLSGRIDKGISIKKDNIIFRDFHSRGEVVLGINSADVAIIPNPVNEFTKYCFPYKLIEYMACRVPIVATDVGDVSLMLKNYQNSLCLPNDSNDLAEKTILQLENNKKIEYNIKNFDWRVLSKKLNNILMRLN